jgi:hypothetical protein
LRNRNLVVACSQRNRRKPYGDELITSSSLSNMHENKDTFPLEYAREQG